MKTKPVPSHWLRREGRRLDVGPYLSGGLEAKVRLEELRARKDRLDALTAGHNGGIFNGPQFSRRWVDDPAYGVPFVGSSSMLMADLSNLPMLRRKDAESAKLSYLRLRSGMTLISCSGTIGRMVYVRPDMDGVWSSQDIMKVVPDPKKVPSGYLYAYLSSKFGVPQVISGTYGAIIQHIEPQHIAGLPVPRLGEKLERRVHELVEKAARKRASSVRLISGLSARVVSALKLPEVRTSSVSAFGTTAVRRSELNRRLDAPYHSLAARDALRAINSGTAPVRPLAKVLKRYFKPPMFKRLWVGGPAFGCQFVSGTDAYRYQAESLRFVSFGTPRLEEFIVEKTWVIFQAAGQIYGLFGKPLFVFGWLDGLFCADDLYRLVPHDEVDGAYIYAFLRTPHGEALLKRQACGNSIPRVWDPAILEMQIPWPGRGLRERISSEVLQAHEAMESARHNENEAIALVEQTIEEAS